MCHRDVAGIFQPSTAVNKQTTSDKCNSVLTTSHKSIIPFNCPKTSLYTTAYPWTYLRTGHLPATPITPPNLTFILESGAALRVMFLTTASSSALIWLLWAKNGINAHQPCHIQSKHDCCCHRCYWHDFVQLHRTMHREAESVCQLNQPFWQYVNARRRPWAHLSTLGFRCCYPFRAFDILLSTSQIHELVDVGSMLWLPGCVRFNVLIFIGRHCLGRQGACVWHVLDQPWRAGWVECFGCFHTGFGRSCLGQVWTLSELQELLASYNRGHSQTVISFVAFVFLDFFQVCVQSHSLIRPNQVQQQKEDLS